MQIFTCRYPRFEPHMGIPVRTTASAPRFKLHYELTRQATLITPTWPMLSLERDAYTREYRTRLELAGAEAIRAELATIAAQHGDQRLVLLCFENLADPGTWCHRTLFAAWWQAKTGQEVPELAERPQATLF
jgi:hypothetical protein